jgi:hypothetical protein
MKSMGKQVRLYKIPEKLETASILDDSLLEHYVDSIKKYGEKARETLNKFSRDNGDLTGSSPFMLVHWQILACFLQEQD